MYVPKIDNRTFEDIVSEIRSLSEAFAAEWDFDAEDPDIGAAAAIIYAKMMCGTIERYNRTPEKNLIEFFNRLGASPRYFQPAGGYLAFEISGSENNVRGEFVKGGAAFAAAGADGTSVTFSVSDPLYVINSSVTDIICSDPEKDGIYRLYSASDRSRCEFGTECRRDDDLQKHIFYFRADFFGSAAQNELVQLRFTPDNADEVLADSFMRSVLEEGIYYSTENGFAKGVELTLKDGDFFFEYDRDNPPSAAEIMGKTGQWFMLPFKSESAVNTAQRLYMEKIGVGMSAAGISPNGVFDEMGELTAETFFPFGKAPIPYSSVYFSCNSVLSRRGSVVTLEFKICYTRIPTCEDTEEETDWKYIMKKSGFKKPKKYDVRIEKVVWEYFSGAGWARLFDDDVYGDVFRGDDDESTKKITFICPDNISEVFLPSGESYAVRARIVSVENYLKTNGYYIVPQIFRPLFSYRFEILPCADTAVTENCLKRELRELKLGSVKMAESLKNEGRCISFSFSSAPDRAGIRMLFVIDKPHTEKRRNHIWEYLTDSGWNPLCCTDETSGLSETGLLVLGENNGFAYSELFSAKGYWIRLRCISPDDYPDKINVRIFPNSVRAENIEKQGEEYFYASVNENSQCRLGYGSVYKAEVSVDEKSAVSQAEAEEMVKSGSADAVFDDRGNLSRLWVKWEEYNGAGKRTYIFDRDNSCIIFGGNGGKMPPESPDENIRAVSYTCGGANGNIPENSEFIPKNNSGMISRIFNPIKMSGGEGKESISRVLERSAEALRLRSRVCAAADFEAAVRAADRSVIKVKAFGGINAAGGTEYGAVTVAVLFRDMESFAEKSGALRRRLCGMCSANISKDKLAVVKPIGINYGLYAEIAVGSCDTVSGVRADIYGRIKEYFELEKGNIGKGGWDIGQLPEKPMIYGIISGIREVLRVGSFSLFMHNEDGDEINQSELERLKRTGMTIPYLNDISINIKVI